MKRETEEAREAAKNFAFARTEEYAAGVRAELAELNKEFDQLSARIDNFSVSAKAGVKAKLEAAREKLRA